MTRATITPGKLFRLLSDTFTARRPAGCDRCRMPLPYLIERPDAVSANWRLGTPPPCPFGCHVVIIDVASELWPLYDLPEHVIAPEAAPADDEMAADKPPSAS